MKILLPHYKDKKVAFYTFDDIPKRMKLFFQCSKCLEFSLDCENLFDF